MKIKKRDRQKIELNLKDIYSLLVDKASDGIWLLDKEFNTLFVNPAMEELLGYTAEEMNGRNLLSFSDSEWVARAKELEKRRESGIKEHHEFLFIHKNGRKMLTRIATTPLYDNSGNFDGAIGIVSDLTLKQESENALKTKEMLNSIAKSAGIGICLINRDYTIEWYNDLFTEWMGPIDKTKGRNCFEVYEGRNSVCPDCQSKVTFETGKICDKERNNITISGSENRTFLVTASPLRDSKGNIIQVVEISKDITDRKLAEQDLIKKSNELKIFNEFFVDRELKMVELKKEINELLQKAGLKKKYPVS
jgi:PAS domain S-box-containing protein